MKISILIVCYNHEDYISDAVDSILMQMNEFDTEVILLDDASTDNTFKVATSKLAGAGNVQLIHNEVNLGITKNYQKGFSLCTGEYVFVLEGDDYWLDAFKVKKQVEFLEQHPFHSMCFHSFILQKGTSRIFEPFELTGEVAPSMNKYKIPPTEGSASFSISDLITIEGLIGTFSVCCYRKKWLDQLPAALFTVTAYDWAVNLFMAHFGLLGRINSVMSVYRVADNATWSSKTDAERSMDVKGLIPVYDQLLSFQYSNLFARKLTAMDAWKENKSVGSIRALTIKDWVPPIVTAILKSILPPAIKSRIRKRQHRP